MKNIVKKLMIAGATSILAVSSAYLIIPFEGEVVNKEGHHVVYKDIVGIDTACWGQTGRDMDGNKLSTGTVYTPEYCEKWYIKELSAYNKQMKKNVKVPLSGNEEVAYTSFIYNVGAANWNSSTLLKKLNSGDREGACRQLLIWNKATFSKKGADSQIKSGQTCTPSTKQKGKYSCTVKGLTNRRTEEYKVCSGEKADVNEALNELALSGEEVDTVD